MSVVHLRLEQSPDERPPHDVIYFIHESDTFFVGTYYKAEEEVYKRFPSHQWADSFIPDYSGNWLLTSLGNIAATTLAGVTFVSFTTGAVLYLLENAHNLVGPTAQRLMPRTNALTTFHITGYTFVADALPVRQKPGTPV
ncbi:hypothetical protein PAXINDRAFT_100897 [Paxillus involutus ATCC 200175]|uniref:Uncharacterized protein n=1 Tax=Paxillus involutus ATCC 200175 TaxID=664439 RepID=A0A0C9U0P9_PAXIN|nr:hypothetical protein PAXINDRAFT_100897 [Paxillus involutus ATCC 200175]